MHRSLKLPAFALLLAWLVACDGSQPPVPATPASVDAIGGGVPTVYYRFNDPTLTPGPAHHWSFASKLPAGTAIYTGDWRLLAGVGVCQQAEAGAMAIGSDLYSDFDLTARVRLGTDAQAGLLFRAQDRNNYFLYTVDSRRQYSSLYLYASGKLSPTKQAVTQVQAGQWRTLRVIVRGQILRGYLDGDLLVETSDTAYFAGGLGLWAQGGACFDSVAVELL